MPGEEAWLVGEWRSNGERKDYLSNLPAEARVHHQSPVGLRTGAPTKEELGLDHFEGRSCAYAFLQHQRRNKAKAGKRTRHGAPKPTLPAIRTRGHKHPLISVSPTTMSARPYPLQNVKIHSAKVVLACPAGSTEFAIHRLISSGRSICGHRRSCSGFRSKKPPQFRHVRPQLLTVRRSSQLKCWRNDLNSFQRHSPSEISPPVPCFQIYPWPVDNVCVQNQTPRQ